MLNPFSISDSDSMENRTQCQAQFWEVHIFVGLG